MEKHLINIQLQVGEFFNEKEQENNTIRYSPHFSIDWPGMYKPVDEPHCGYDGGKCPRAKGNTEVAAGVLGGKFISLISVQV